MCVCVRTDVLLPLFGNIREKNDFPQALLYTKNVLELIQLVKVKKKKEIQEIL